MGYYNHLLGWFTDFLSAKLFIHINKLSYGVYLLNPLTIATIHGLRDGSSHFSPIISVSLAPKSLQDIKCCEKFSHNYYNTWRLFKSHFTFFLQWVMTLGMMIIVYCVSFVFTLFFEIPYHNLASVLLRNRPKSTFKVKSK